MSLEQYHAALRLHGCIVTGRLDDLVLHHVIGASITERIGERGSKKRSDWLVLPLHVSQHCAQHAGSLHAGIESWEARWGVTEAELIDRLCQSFNLDLWALAAGDKQQSKERRQRRMGSSKIIKHDGVLRR